MKNFNSIASTVNEKNTRLVSLNAAIAVTRFGLGAAPGDIEAAMPNPKKWLIDQLRPIFLSSDFPSSTQALKLNNEFRKTRRAVRQVEASDNVDQVMLEKIQSEQKILRPQPILHRYTQEILKKAITSENSLAWRLFDFFSNHFSVGADGAKMAFLAPTLEKEAIAENLFGQFEDMLIAVESHPAMITYLNNENSFGPNSKVGKRNKKKGLNENLAREILELHTLGVKSGYSQNDVIELAKAISGWSTLRRRELQQVNDYNKSAFIFRPNGHEPGTRIILKKSYANTGQEQGLMILKDLARHPATARHICQKIATHFISDTPSESLVNEMTERWIRTQGNIKEVVIAMINNDDAWNTQQQKFKTPREFLISSSRATRSSGRLDRRAHNILNELGQKPFAAGSPAGYPNDNASWSGADALHARIEFSAAYAKKIKHSAPDLANQSLGALLSSHTGTSIKRAESQVQGRTLFFMSPEFQRR